MLTTPSPSLLPTAPFDSPERLPTPSAVDPERLRVREAFDDFVGQTFFSQLLASMRSTVDKPAYFHGGRAEEVFQGQLDQVLAERMSDAAADRFTGPMFELFMLPRG